MKKLKTKIKILFALFIVIIAFYFMFINFIGNSNNNIGDQISIDQIRKIAKLQSVEYICSINEFIDYKGKEIGPIKIPGTYKFYFASITGKVTAGIDFNKITKFKVDGDTAKIELPKAEILEAITYPETKWEKYYEGLFAEIEPKEITNLDIKAKHDLLLKAKKNKILDKADENAKTAIQLFLKAAGIKKVIFLK